jgi:hypothetical protein
MSGELRGEARVWALGVPYGDVCFMLPVCVICRQKAGGSGQDISQECRHGSSSQQQQAQAHPPMSRLNA